MHNGPNIITDGLVLALDAANVKSYPTAGTTWNDLSRGGNNGTLTNGPTFDGGNGGSIVFDGVNDVVNLQNSTFTQFPHTSPWTFSITGKIISQNTTFPGFIIKGSAGGSGVLFFYTSFTPNFYIKHNNSQPGISVSTTLPFVVTWSHNGSGTTKIYLNGKYVTNGPTMVNTDTTNNLMLGRGDAFGNVSIYNVLKYNKQLTDSEVLQNYKATKTRFGL
jgi:hypothetical protein